MEFLKNSKIANPEFLKLSLIPASEIETRAAFLTWLLMNARLGAEMQCCKLTLLFDFFGYPTTPSNNTAAGGNEPGQPPHTPTPASQQLWTVEPAFSVIHYLFTSNGQNAATLHMGNSLVDFMIKSAPTLFPHMGDAFSASVGAAFRALQTGGL